MRNLATLILLLILFSCKSFDTDTNLETEFVPGPKPVDLELKDHLDLVLKKMYPKMGKYKMLTKQKTAVANFIMGGNIYEIKFDLDGNWTKSEVQVAYDFTLPGGVQEFLKSDEHSGWILTERKLNQSPEEIRYKFVWKKGEELKTIWVDRNGVILRDKTDTQELVK